VKSWIDSAKVESYFQVWRLDMFLQFIELKDLPITPEDLAKDFKGHGFSYYELLLASVEDPEALKKET
jgi:hypothetical protein